MRIVAVSTMIFGVILLVIFLFLFPLFMLFLTPIFYVLFLVSLFAFGVSYGIRVGSRRAWYASMVFWIVFTSFFVWLYSLFGWWQWFFN